jgi:cytochrome c556
VPHDAERAKVRNWRRVLPVVAAVNALLAVVGAMAVHGTSSEDGKAAFERREDTMKHMGRPFYLGIGRVVKGTAAYGPDTVTAAETVASLAGTLDRTLFPPGSDVDGSKIKPAIFAAGDHIDQLIAAVQTATAQLVPAVKTGDKGAITAAYIAVANACNACHLEFRKEE